MKADEQHFSQLKQIYDKHPKAYHMMLRNREHAGLRSWIGQQTPMLADGIYALSTKCYWILHGMHDFPVCQQCGQRFGHGKNVCRSGYSRFCSRRCACRNDQTKRKLRQTCVAKYGVTNAAKAECVKSRCIHHMQAKYGAGVTNAWQASCVKEKICATKLEKHGSKTYNNRVKAEESCLKKYGVSCTSQAVAVRRKQQHRYVYNGITFDNSQTHQDHTIYGVIKCV